MAFRSPTLIVLLATAALAFGDDVTLPDFTTLSLDQLANVKVTSFTKKQQTLSQVAGAVYVITQEQIARSGLTSVPELLRLAPGIDVARVNGNQWSISARGPVGVYSNKLLVLIDGRSIYSPIFAGVYWDLGMPMLDDIERIEVIRGPGATIWGANAVLGVINIITKRSQDTQGTTVTAGAGSADRAFGTTRMGGKTGSTSYRAYFGGSDNAPLSQSSGSAANDGWASVQSGFRLDGERKQDKWLLEGDLFRAPEDNTGVTVSIPNRSIIQTPAHFDSTAGNLTGEWRRRVGEKGEFRIQSYFDYANRPEPEAPTASTSTGDTEIQYDYSAGRIHYLSVGGGARLISENIRAQDGLSFSPASLTYLNVNGFAQDEMHFAHDKVLLTAGAKLEHNHFGGWEPEPSANLLWMPAKRHSVWISAAWALRTPTLFDRSVHDEFAVNPASAATNGLPVIVSINGSPAFSSESVNDFEAGYRGQLSKIFSVDVSVFYDQFSDLRSYLGGNPVLAFSPAPYLAKSEYEGNYSGGVGKGAEASIGWQVLPRWKLEGSYTYNIVDANLNSSAPAGTVYGGGKEPSRNRWSLQSYVNLSKSWNLDTFLYWTSQASPVNLLEPSVLVPSYTRLDIRLGYKVGRRWELSFAGQNLLQARHLEALAEILTGYSYVNRSVYLKSTWQF